MRQSIKKIVRVVLCGIMIGSLAGCSLMKEPHCSRKQAEAIAEDLLSQDVTYVDTKNNRKEDIRYYIFKDENGYEFAIESTRRQGWFSVGKYSCWVNDSYSLGVTLAHRDDIIEILEKYELIEYVDLEHMYDEDIFTAGAAYLNQISIDVPMGTREENESVVKRVAAAGAEIDNILQLSYDVNYNGEIPGTHMTFENFAPFGGINLTFWQEKVGFDGELYKSYDIGFFDWSFSPEDRLSEEALTEILTKQLDEALSEENEEDTEMSKE